MKSTAQEPRRLRIALMHPCYWPEVRRGSERFIHDLGAGLAARGDRPRLITSHSGPRTEAVEDGLDVVRLRRPRGRRLQLGVRDQYVTHFPAARRALRATDPDVAHALYPVDALAARRWARRTGRPLVFSLMGMPRPAALDRRIWKTIVAKAIVAADVTVCLSRRAAELTSEAFGASPRVINPGVDLEVFHPVAPRADVPTILCPADLSDVRKGGPLLRLAFRALRRKHPEARLVLSAPGGSSADETEPGIVYENLDSEERLARAYSSAWATVLLSKAEAFGLVLAESLACGTPAIGTRGGGADEIIIADDVGRLTETEDPEEIAGLIAETMSEGEEDRAACIARAEELSVDRTTDAYMALYRELAR
jgi:glycosyltransferase involved in cell wall biosynthesis